MTETLVRELALAPDEAREHLAGWAEWVGAEVTTDGGAQRLRLATQQGLKRGVLTARVEIEPTTEGSRLTFRVEQEQHWPDRGAVSILTLSAAGGLATVIWPFFPGLTPVMPLAVVIAVAGWFLVMTRTRHQGLEEFVHLVCELPDDPENGAPFETDAE